jgi:N utilization substance protein A
LAARRSTSFRGLEDPAQFIENSLKPARVLRISYDTFRDRARVVVSQDQLPLAIGKAGQNVRLSARLTRYKIDVMSEEAAARARQVVLKSCRSSSKPVSSEDFLREISSTITRFPWRSYPLRISPSCRSKPLRLSPRDA